MDNIKQTKLKQICPLMEIRKLYLTKNEIEDLRYIGRI